MLMLSSPRVGIEVTSAIICVFVCALANVGSSDDKDMAALANKLELRKTIAKLVKSLSVQKKKEESDIVADRFLNHPAYKESKRISIYVDRSDEIETRKIIKNAIDCGKECFIPRYDKADMQMLKLSKFEDLEKLSKNKENILQHSHTELTEDAMKTGGLDLVVVPGRAFSEDGKRLGRGKGYYDNYLSQLREISPNCKTVGLAFGCQVMDDVPMSEHDVPLNHVIHPLSK